jgi:hypothetical protein
MKKISNTAKIVQLVRTLISCVNNENSNFSLGLPMGQKIIQKFFCKTNIKGIIVDLFLLFLKKEGSVCWFTG